MHVRQIAEDGQHLLRLFVEYPERTLMVIPASMQQQRLSELHGIVEHLLQAREEAAQLQGFQAIIAFVAHTPELRNLQLLGAGVGLAEADLRQRETEIARYLAQATPGGKVAAAPLPDSAQLAPLLQRLQHNLAAYPPDRTAIGPLPPRPTGEPMSGDTLSRIEFAENLEPRCPVVLLLDTSASMNDGGRIQQLNAGLMTLKEALVADVLASLRVELAVITFGGAHAQVLNVREGSGTEAADADRAFVGVQKFMPPQLYASGATPMGAGARLALKLINDRKSLYKANGIDYYRPWLFLITDGDPNDTGWEDAARQVREEQAARKLISFAIGVEEADMQKLAQFSTVPPKKLRGLAFGELFQWLSKSLSSVSRSQTGDRVQLPPSDTWDAI